MNPGTQRKKIAAGLIGSLLSMAVPAVALADAPVSPPQLALKTHGRVDKWNIEKKEWEEYHGGYAHVGETYRAVEGGEADGFFEGVKEWGTKDQDTREHFKLHSCSAIRFITLNLEPSGYTMYCKAFGQISNWLPHDRQAVDDFKYEFPISLEVIGKEAIAATGNWTHTIYQTPNARQSRLAVTEDSAAKEHGLSYIEGKVQSLDPDAGTFVLTETSGAQRSFSVVFRSWSQLAKPKLSSRIMNETPAQMVNELHDGQHLIIYGVVTAPQTGSVPLNGNGAFDASPPLNFFSTVVYPDNGLYIYGATFVLASPVTPMIGSPTVFNGVNTLILNAGVLPTSSNILAGVRLVSMACEIGAEFFVVPPAIAGAIVSTGAIGGTVIYALVGIGAIAVFTHHNGGGTTPFVSLP